MAIARVVLAKHAGFCFGVRRAVETAEQSAPAVTLGPIIHNPQVVESLRAMGVVSVDSPRQLAEGARVVKGLMESAASVAPGAEGFAAAAFELDPETEDLRYGVVRGTNCVYMMERASFVAAHVPTFEEAKAVIRQPAEKKAKEDAFKASVDKVADAAREALKGGKAFDASLFDGATVSTGLTFTARAPGAFPNSGTVSFEVASNLFTKISTGFYNNNTSPALEFKTSYAFSEAKDACLLNGYFWTDAGGGLFPRTMGSADIFLNDTTQRVATLCGSANSRFSGRWPATIEVLKQCEAGTHLVDQNMFLSSEIEGNVTIAMYGTENPLILTNRAFASYGDILVAAGTLEFTADASWLNGTNVTISCT